MDGLRNNEQSNTTKWNSLAFCNSFTSLRILCHDFTCNSQEQLQQW